MEDHLLDKIICMIESPDQEMQRLGVELFINTSENYDDYRKLRTCFPDRLSKEMDLLFNDMFAIYSGDHIREKFNEYSDYWRAQHND